MPGSLTPAKLLTTSTLLGLQTRDRIKFASIFLDKFFGSALPFSTKKIHFEEIFKGKKLAPFCSPFVDGKVHKAKGSTMNSLEPPYVKSKHRVDPARLIERTAGEALFGSLTPTQRLHAAVAANQIDEEEEIIRRLEWMCVQLVLTGKVLCQGESADEIEIDYGRSTENTITLAGLAKWDAVDKETYDPRTDLEEWADNSSGMVSEVWLDKKAWNLFSSFKVIRDLINKQSGSKTAMELGPQTSSVMKYKGNYGDFDFYVVDHRYENEAGVNTPFMPDNTLLFCGVYDGKMAYGAIQDGEAIENGLYQGTRYARHWREGGDVIQQYTKRECAPCPVTLDPDFFVTVKVA